MRPPAPAVERALEAIVRPGGGLLARVSHRPANDPGWLELLASGLTFDISGLAPADPAELLPPRQRLALAANEPSAQAEAVQIVPGPHVSAGGAMLPVVRVLCELAAGLAGSLAATAVCWRPAGTWMATGYFTRIVDDWINGGAFPALGLTSIARDAGGAVTSSGLAYFTGQEVRLAPLAGESPADAAKLVVRIIDALVRQGPVPGREVLTGPDGEELVVQPDEAGTMLTIWRNG